MSREGGEGWTKAKSQNIVRDMKRTCLWLALFAMCVVTAGSSGCMAVATRVGSYGKAKIYPGVRSDAYLIAHPSEVGGSNVVGQIVVVPVSVIDMVFSAAFETIVLPFELADLRNSCRSEKDYPIADNSAGESFETSVRFKQGRAACLDCAEADWLQKKYGPTLPPQYTNFYFGNNRCITIRRGKGLYDVVTIMLPTNGNRMAYFDVRGYRSFRPYPILVGDDGSSYSTALRFEQGTKDYKDLEKTETGWLYIKDWAPLAVLHSDNEFDHSWHREIERHGDTFYDIYTLALPTGEKRVVYFEVTNYRYYLNDQGLSCLIRPTRHVSANEGP